MKIFHKIIFYIFIVYGLSLTMFGMNDDYYLPTDDDTLKFSEHILCRNEWNIKSVEFSQDGRRIIITYKDNSTKILDPNNSYFSKLCYILSETLSFIENIAQAACCNSQMLDYMSDYPNAPDNTTAISPNGQFKAIASNDYSIRVLDRNNQCMATLRGHHNQIISLAFNQVGDCIVSASLDGTITIWQILKILELGLKLELIEKAGDDECSVCLTPIQCFVQNLKNLSILPCHHLICNNCKDVIKNTALENESYIALCPICRREFPID